MEEMIFQMKMMVPYLMVVKNQLLMEDMIFQMKMMVRRLTAKNQLLMEDLVFQMKKMSLNLINLNISGSTKCSDLYYDYLLHVIV